MAQVQLETAAWRAVAWSAIDAFIRDRGGAVVWPEVEAALTTRQWAAENAEAWFDPQFHPLRAQSVARIDAHHLTKVRPAMVTAGLIAPSAAPLQGRNVTAWIHVPTREEGQGTLIDRRAAARRRLYRSFLGWTSSELCGDIAERVVQATMTDLAGKHLWLDEVKRGHVSFLDGVKVPGGPLDHAGQWAIDPSRPGAGFIPFAVEVKNLRSVVYPSNNEVWDLLAKLGAFPHRVPILITRRVHYWTYRLFAEIGAIAHQTRNQWFSPTIKIDRFAEVTGTLGFTDAHRVADPDATNVTLSNFFTKTLRTPSRVGEDTRPLMVRSAERWARAAPICVRYLSLRNDQLDPQQREETYRQFLEDLDNEGFDTSGFTQIE